MQVLWRSPYYNMHQKKQFICSRECYGQELHIEENKTKEVYLFISKVQ